MSRILPHVFVCGIGGSGMLPLAVILKGLGYGVSGSDRSRDQGRTPEKFKWLESQGITLYPQDGIGIQEYVDEVVISKAVENTIPDLVAAHNQNIPVKLRAHLLVDLFNAARTRIAVAGTSGKTTTTGMTGFLLKEAGLDPTVMNGGIFRNYVSENPYSTAFVGQGDIFVSEVDESDGIDIVRTYRPTIAILHNVTLDHQSMDELRAMFAAFCANTDTLIVNYDDEEALSLARSAGTVRHILTYSALGHKDADFRAAGYVPRPDGSDVLIENGAESLPLALRLPGRHNVSNALAALAAASAAGLELGRAVEILARFEGIRRRMEVTGTARGITVMDDFAHNPDKIAATLSTLHEFPGRLHVFFQPHGYGFLKVVGPELVESFVSHLKADDTLYMVEPLYLGGTVDKTVSAAQITARIKAQGVAAHLCDGRAEAQAMIAGNARPGDRIVIMGARDDTLSSFAKDILETIQ